jgi:hypothetical protein
MKSRTRHYLPATVLLTLGLCFCLSIAAGTSNPKVFYAGIAYLGSHELVESNYPHALKLNRASPEGPGRLDQTLKALLEETPPSEMDLAYGLANLRKGESLTMAIAIDKEQVSVESFNFDGQATYKVIAEVSAQILFYDYESMTLVTSYPDALALNHVIESASRQQVDKELPALFEVLYFGDEQGPGLLQNLVNRLSTLQLDQRPGLRFQMESIDTSNKAADQLPHQLSLNQFQQYLGQYFSSQLSNQTSAAVLPYIRGYALGRQMPGRFANGEVFVLTLPEPDFVFNLAVERFIANANAQQLLHGAQVRFSLREPVRQKIYIDDQFMFAVAKPNSAERVQTDDWSAYEDALESLIDNLVVQLKEPSRKWFKTHARNAASYRQFKDRKDMFND